MHFKSSMYNFAIKITQIVFEIENPPPSFGEKNNRDQRVFSNRGRCKLNELKQTLFGEDQASLGSGAPAFHIDFQGTDVKKGLIDLAADNDLLANRKFDIAVESDRAGSIVKLIAVAVQLLGDLADEGYKLIVLVEIVLAFFHPVNGGDFPFVAIGVFIVSCSGAKCGENSYCGHET